MQRRVTRRSFLLGLSLLTVARGGAAQDAGRIYRIALVHPSRPAAQMTEAGPSTWRAFFAELRRRGFDEGRNLVVERRSAEGQRERFESIVKEVVGLAPDVIVVNSTPLALRFKAATTTVPIVALASNPVSSKLVASFARPGGNITGLTPEPGPSFVAKLLELVKESFPHVASAAILSGGSSGYPGLADMQREGASLGLSSREFTMGDSYGDDRYAAVFAEIAAWRAGAVIVLDVAEHFPREVVIARLAAQHRLPLISQYRHFTEAGGTLSYGVDWVELERRRAAYVADILRGTKPADLPVEQPAKFELVINRKSAKALRLSLPSSVLIRADEVIE